MGQMSAFHALNSKWPAVAVVVVVSKRRVQFIWRPAIGGVFLSSYLSILAIHCMLK